jgi:hypothetical protein
MLMISGGMIRVGTPGQNLHLPTTVKCLSVSEQPSRQLHVVRGGLFVSNHGANLLAHDAQCYQVFQIVQQH